MMPLSTKAEDLSQIRDKVDTLTDQRIALEGEVQNFDNQLQFLQEKIDLANKESEEANKKLTEVERELAVKNALLSENLRVMYEEGQTSFFELLFKCSSFSDFVDRNEYLNINRQKLKENSDAVTTLRNQVKEQSERLELNQKIAKVFKDSLERQRLTKNTELDKVKEEERIIREKFAARLSKFGSSSYCKSDNKVIKAKYSVFSFPIDCGYISQGYGMTEFASVDKAYRGAIHNGVDVGIGTGTEIRSIGNGEVYATGVSPSGGWGNWVMVKQDKVKIKIGEREQELEFYSLYAHMIAETTLKVGERVNSGQVMGFVGGTPYWAPHLHFSLFLSPSGWSNGNVGPYPGNTVDPLDYMDIPISTNGTDWDVAYAH
jgi:murein DD-endopeptidase MepM/ murein hydrolase activator NlpD